MSKSRDAFRTIGEVAEWLDTPAHVLRFWESKFPQVKPVKRAGGRRYYRPADMTLLGGIKKLLHDDGLTIKGVQKVLSEQGVKAVSAMAPSIDDDKASEHIEGRAISAESDDDVPARIEVDRAEDAARLSAAEVEAEEPIQDAPFIEAEPPASTVVPFTGGGRLSETSAPADEAESTPDVADAPLPDAPIDTPEIVEDAPATPEDAVQAALRDAAAAQDDVASEPEPEPDTNDTAPTQEEPAQGSLFGTTPEFLAKPLSDRVPGPAADVAAEHAEGTAQEAPETVSEETPMPDAEPAAADKVDAEVAEAPEENAQDAELEENTMMEAAPADAEDAVEEGAEVRTPEDVSSEDDDTTEPPEAKETAEAAEAQDTPAPAPAGFADTALPRGPLSHLGGIARLSPELAARIAPELAALRAHLDAAS